MLEYRYNAVAGPCIGGVRSNPLQKEPLPKYLVASRYHVSLIEYLALGQSQRQRQSLFHHQSHPTEIIANQHQEEYLDSNFKTLPVNCVASPRK